MREIAKKLKISYNAVYYSCHRTAKMDSNQNRKRTGRPWCTTEQEDKYIRVSSLRNRCLTSPQLAASLNRNRKNTSLYVNSEETTPGCWPSRQSSSVQCLCSFAHLNFVFLLASLRYGFFCATLPGRPASRSHLFTADVETGILQVLFNEAAS